MLWQVFTPKIWIGINVMDVIQPHLSYHQAETENLLENFKIY